MLFVLLSFGVHCRIDHYCFIYVIVGFAFDSALPYLAIRRSTEIIWSSTDNVSRWFQYSFAGNVFGFINLVVPSVKRDANGAFGTDRVYGPRAGVCTVPSTDRGSPASPMAYMPPSPRKDIEVASTCPALLIIRLVYEVDLDAEDEWNLSDIPPSGEYKCSLMLSSLLDRHS